MTFFFFKLLARDTKDNGTEREREREREVMNLFPHPMKQLFLLQINTKNAHNSVFFRLK